MWQRFWTLMKNQWNYIKETDNDDDDDNDVDTDAGTPDHYNYYKKAVRPDCDADDREATIAISVQNLDNSVKEIKLKVDEIDRRMAEMKRPRRSTSLSSLSSSSRSSFLNENHPDDRRPRPRRDKTRSVVRLPKDPTKHPWFVVFAKESADATDVVFATGRARKRTRSSDSMDLVYRGVHPNPRLAVHCIAEDWLEQGFKYSKRPRRSVYRVESSLQNVKQIIYDNV
uniref:38.7 kDa protein n=1 Tax=Lymantria dispar multicapsid nuclear polyhedrosis virus TaxID=10449 RepID=A0A1B1MQZ8_NPVLD|nr:38.7 kDa protein [Lymantria dispar multiple nucleopolyhedrovirus]